MCCGSSRRNISTGAHRAERSPAVQPQRSTPARPPAAPSAKPVFEYIGGTALTIVSPISRKTYRFERPGARVEVEPRDRSWVAFVPNLKRVG